MGDLRSGETAGSGDPRRARSVSVHISLEMRPKQSPVTRDAGWLAAKHTIGKSGMRVPEARLGTAIGAHVALPLCAGVVAQVPVRYVLIGATLQSLLAKCRSGHILGRARCR